MTILVTGSAGRIGRSLVLALLDRGEKVRGYDLRTCAIAHAHFEEVIGSLDDRTCAGAALEGVTAVFHLGAYMSWLQQDQDRIFAANVEGVRQVLAAALAARVKRFVFASSGEVYPEGAPDYLPVDETHPTRPRSVYGLSKLIGEEMVRWAGRSQGLAFTILRFSHTQDAAELLDPESFFSGPRFFLQPRIAQQEAMGNAPAASVLRAADDGRPALVLARNESGRPFRMMITDTRDMVAGLVLALDAPRLIGETCNLGASEPVDFAAALPKMAAITGLPLRVVDLPGPGVFYETSNARFRDLTGFEPAYPFERMLEEAAGAWRAKRMS